MAKVKAKDAIRISFGEILNEKPYHQITVKEIVMEAGVTRQIFYYYFSSMIELLEYFEDGTVDIILKEKKKMKKLSDAYDLFFRVMIEKSNLIKNLNYSESKGVLRDALERMAKHLYSRILTDVFDKTRVSNRDREFLIGYYTYGFASILYEWVQKGMDPNYQYLVKNLSALVDDSLPEVVKRFEEL